MKDENEMNALNAEAFKSGLIYGYGYEDAIREDFAREGLDIDKVEDWPIERINRVQSAGHPKGQAGPAAESPIPRVS